VASENAVQRGSSCGGCDPTVQRRWAQAGRELYSGPILGSSLRRCRCRYYCISLAEGHFESPSISAPVLVVFYRCRLLPFPFQFGICFFFL
jgi:hypothetical protein